MVLVVILSLTLIACSNKYESMYNLDKQVEFVIELSEEEVIEFLEKVSLNLENEEFITYEAYIVNKNIEGNSIIKEDILSIEEKLKIQYQKNEDIKFKGEQYTKEKTLDETNKVKWEFYCYNENQYCNFITAKEKVYITEAYTSSAFNDFSRETYSDALSQIKNLYTSYNSWGKDENGNIIAYKEVEENGMKIQSICVFVDDKLVYHEEKGLFEGDIVSRCKENYSYDKFREIKEDFNDYKLGLGL